MAKKKGTFRNSFFFLLGVLIYSLLFWLTGKNYTQVFGAVLVGLMCYQIYLLSFQKRLEAESIKPKDVIFLCVGIIFDSFSGGFPFNNLSPF
jgi:hypothetical protein